MVSSWSEPIDAVMGLVIWLCCVIVSAAWDTAEGMFIFFRTSLRERTEDPASPPEDEAAGIRNE